MKNNLIAVECDNEYAYVMDREYSIDIDEPYDLWMAEMAIRHLHEMRGTSRT